MCTVVHPKVKKNQAISISMDCTVQLLLNYLGRLRVFSSKLTKFQLVKDKVDSDSIASYLDTIQNRVQETKGMLLSLIINESIARILIKRIF